MPCGACHGLLCRVTVRREHALWSGIRVKASRVFSEGLAKGRARCHSGCGLLWGLGPSSKHAHIDRYTQTHTGTQQHTQTHTGTQAHTETHRETQRHIQAHTLTHRHAQTHRDTRIDTYTHILTHTHTHRHTHTHKHAQTHVDAQTDTDTRAHTHRQADAVRRAVGRSSPAVRRPGPLPLLCCRWGWLQLPVRGLLQGTPPRQALPPLPSGSVSLWLLCDKLGKGARRQARPTQGPVPSAVGQNPIRVPEPTTSTQGTPRKVGAAATSSVSPHKGLPWWPGG